MKNTTLCYLEQDGSWLLLHRNKKKNDPNHDKWIGIGGKFEENESPDDCVRREFREETGLELTEYRYCGIVTFVSDCWEGEYMHLFHASACRGSLRDCDEGELAWIPETQFAALPQWEGGTAFSCALCGSMRRFFAEAPLRGRPAGRNRSERPPDGLTPTSCYAIINLHSLQKKKGRKS